MRSLIVLVLSATGALAQAGVPCEGVNRALTATRRRELAPVLARQLGAPSAVVLESMVLRSWSVVWVSTQTTGSPFLFYSGPPEHTHFLTAWNSAARTVPAAQVEAWAAAHAPGIPAALAHCFAWHVGIESTTGAR